MNDVDIFLECCNSMMTGVNIEVANNWLTSLIVDWNKCCEISVSILQSIKHNGYKVEPVLICLKLLSNVFVEVISNSRANGLFIAVMLEGVIDAFSTLLTRALLDQETEFTELITSLSATSSEELKLKVLASIPFKARKVLRESNVSRFIALKQLTTNTITSTLILHTNHWNETATEPLKYVLLTLNEWMHKQPDKESLHETKSLLFEISALEMTTKHATYNNSIYQLLIQLCNTRFLPMLQQQQQQNAAVDARCNECFLLLLEIFLNIVKSLNSFECQHVTDVNVMLLTLFGYALQIVNSPTDFISTDLLFVTVDLISGFLEQHLGILIDGSWERATARSTVGLNFTTCEDLGTFLFTLINRCFELPSLFVSIHLLDTLTLLPGLLRQCRLPEDEIDAVHKPHTRSVLSVIQSRCIAGRQGIELRHLLQYQHERGTGRSRGELDEETEQYLQELWEFRCEALEFINEVVVVWAEDESYMQALHAEVMSVLSSIVQDGSSGSKQVLLQLECHLFLLIHLTDNLLATADAGEPEAIVAWYELLFASMLQLYPTGDEMSGAAAGGGSGPPLLLWHRVLELWFIGCDSLETEDIIELLTEHRCEFHGRSVGSVQFVELLLQFIVKSLLEPKLETIAAQALNKFAASHLVQSVVGDASVAYGAFVFLVQWIAQAYNVSIFTVKNLHSQQRIIYTLFDTAGRLGAIAMRCGSLEATQVMLSLYGSCITGSMGIASLQGMQNVQVLLYYLLMATGCTHGISHTFSGETAAHDSSSSVLLAHIHESNKQIYLRGAALLLEAPSLPAQPFTALWNALVKLATFDWELSQLQETDEVHWVAILYSTVTAGVQHIQGMTIVSAICSLLTTALRQFTVTALNQSDATLKQLIALCFMFMIHPESIFNKSTNKPVNDTKDCEYIANVFKLMRQVCYSHASLIAVEFLLNGSMFNRSAFNGTIEAVSILQLFLQSVQSFLLRDQLSNKLATTQTLNTALEVLNKVLAASATDSGAQPQQPRQQPQMVQSHTISLLERISSIVLARILTPTTSPAAAAGAAAMSTEQGNNDSSTSSLYESKKHQVYERTFELIQSVALKHLSPHQHQHQHALFVNGSSSGSYNSNGSSSMVSIYCHAVASSLFALLQQHHSMSASVEEIATLQQQISNFHEVFVVRMEQGRAPANIREFFGR